MYYRNTTQTPNVLFDEYLKKLTESELKVLMVVIRRTIGMIDPNDSTRRTPRAWISQKLFMLCTGLSGKAVSHGVELLIQKKLITVTDIHYRICHTKALRRRASKLYYSSNLLLELNEHKSTHKATYHNAVTNGNTIKLSSSKQLSNYSTQGKRKLSDRERIAQILAKEKPT